jgi:hypothetical protein
MGLRDTGWIETQARSQGFALLADVAMPAHNITLIFRLASGAVRGVPRPDRSPLQQQQLARGQEGQEVPIKGHQAFAIREHGGGDPAITDGVPHSWCSRQRGSSRGHSLERAPSCTPSTARSTPRNSWAAANGVGSTNTRGCVTRRRKPAATIGIQAIHAGRQGVEAQAETLPASPLEELEACLEG